MDRAHIAQRQEEKMTDGDRLKRPKTVYGSVQYKEFEIKGG